MYVTTKTERVSLVMPSAPPYGSLDAMVTGAARIQPTQDKPWKIQVDPVDRNISEVFLDGLCSQNENAKKCIENIKKEFSGSSNPITVEQSTRWSFVNAVIRMSDITIESLDPLSPIQINPLGSESIFDAISAKCRVFEIFGSRVTLKDMNISVADCMTFYKSPEQYTADDGVMVTFSGKTPRNSSVENVEFHGPLEYKIANGTDDPMSAPTTAVRVQQFEYGVVDATGFVMQDVTTSNVNVTCTLWDYFATTAPSINATTYMVSPNYIPVVLYKQAYEDTNPPDVEANNTMVFNVSGLISPSFANFKPTVIRVPSETYTSSCDNQWVEISFAIFGSLVCIVIIVFIAKSAVDVHSDTNANHLRIIELERELKKRDPKQNALLTTQQPSLSVTGNMRSRSVQRPVDETNI
jgi:hypothetical protein